MLNIAVVAPMPAIRTPRSVAKKPGFRRRRRKAKRTSEKIRCMTLISSRCRVGDVFYDSPVEQMDRACRASCVFTAVGDHADGRARRVQLAQKIHHGVAILRIEA